jgi:tRNA1(Val) A37 N6-methylase TrmN6
METLSNGFTLSVSEGAFPLSTDSIALGGFAELKKDARVLDLGSGCGTLGLLLCAKYDTCRVTGIELDPEAHEMALYNAEANGISARLTSICADVKTLSNEIAPGSFDCCVSNPPYFSGGPASGRTPLARREDCCTPADLFTAAAKALKYGGDFFLVHKPERLAELIARGSERHLKAKRLLLLRHKQDGPIALLCLQFRKGGKPGLLIEEYCLFGTNDEPTAFYQSVYHITED